MVVMREEKSHLSRRFCYKCGAIVEEGELLIDGLCQKCFFGEHSLLRLPGLIEARVCRKCGAFLMGNKWQVPGDKDSAVEEAIKSIVLSQLRIAQWDGQLKFFAPSEVKGVKISVRASFKSGREARAEVQVLGKVHPLQKVPHSERASVDVKLNFVSCNACSLKSARHYGAILQVRGVNEDEKMRIKKMLEGYVEKAGKRDRESFIAKEEDRRGGFDLYVNPLGLARHLASLLKSEFKASVVESAKFTGVTKDGRRKYVVSIVARLKKGLKRGEDSSLCSTDI
jgi:NMD protein affecting ribosome stability and mRNA decay